MPVDAVEVDEREPALADHLDVVAGDRVAPPGLLHPPAVADLDRLAPAVPADGDGLAGGVQSRPRWPGARAAGGSRAGSPSAARARPSATSSAPRGAAPRGRAGRPAGRGPPRTSGRAAPAASPAARRGRPAARTAGAADRPPGSRPASSRSRRATAAGGGSRSSRANRRRSIASGSAVGSGKRCSTSTSRRRPGPGEREVQLQRSCARVAARPRAGSWPVSAPASRWRTKRSGSSSSDGGSMGSAQGQSLGGPARPERVGLLAPGPGVEPRALVPEPGDERGPGELGHGPDPAQPEPREPGPDIGVRGEQAGRVRGEERGLATGRDDDRPRRARAWTAAMVAAKRVPAMPARTRAGSPATPRQGCGSAAGPRPGAR